MATNAGAAAPGSSAAAAWSSPMNDRADGAPRTTQSATQLLSGSTAPTSPATLSFNNWPDLPSARLKSSAAPGASPQLGSGLQLARLGSFIANSSASGGYTLTLAQLAAAATARVGGSISALDLASGVDGGGAVAGDVARAVSDDDDDDAFRDGRSSFGAARLSSAVGDETGESDVSNGTDATPSLRYVLHRAPSAGLPAPAAAGPSYMYEIRPRNAPQSGAGADNLFSVVSRGSFQPKKMIRDMRGRQFSRSQASVVSPDGGLSLARKPPRSLRRQSVNHSNPELSSSSAATALAVSMSASNASLADGMLQQDTGLRPGTSAVSESVSGPVAAASLAASVGGTTETVTESATSGLSTARFLEETFSTVSGSAEPTSTDASAFTNGNPVDVDRSDSSKQSNSAAIFTGDFSVATVGGDTGLATAKAARAIPAPPAVVTMPPAVVPAPPAVVPAPPAVITAPPVAESHAKQLAPPPPAPALKPKTISRVAGKQLQKPSSPQPPAHDPPTQQTPTNLVIKATEHLPINASAEISSSTVPIRSRARELEQALSNSSAAAELTSAPTPVSESETPAGKQQHVYGFMPKDYFERKRSAAIAPQPAGTAPGANVPPKVRAKARDAQMSQAASGKAPVPLPHSSAVAAATVAASQRPPAPLPSAAHQRQSSHNTRPPSRAPSRRPSQPASRPQSRRPSRPPSAQPPSMQHQQAPHRRPLSHSGQQAQSTLASGPRRSRSPSRPPAPQSVPSQAQHYRQLSQHSSKSHLSPSPSVKSLSAGPHQRTSYAAAVSGSGAPAISNSSRRVSTPVAVEPPQHPAPHAIVISGSGSALGLDSSDGRALRPRSYANAVSGGGAHVKVDEFKSDAAPAANPPLAEPHHASALHQTPHKAGAAAQLNANAPKAEAKPQPRSTPTVQPARGSISSFKREMLHVNKSATLSRHIAAERNPHSLSLAAATSTSIPASYDTYAQTYQYVCSLMSDELSLLRLYMQGQQLLTPQQMAIAETMMPPPQYVALVQMQETLRTYHVAWKQYFDGLDAAQLHMIREQFTVFLVEKARQATTATVGASATAALTMGGAAFATLGGSTMGGAYATANGGAYATAGAATMGGGAYATANAATIGGSAYATASAAAVGNDAGALQTQSPYLPATVSGQGVTRETRLASPNSTPATAIMHGAAGYGLALHGPMSARPTVAGSIISGSFGGSPAGTLRGGSHARGNDRSAVFGGAHSTSLTSPQSPPYSLSSAAVVTRDARVHNDTRGFGYQQVLYRGSAADGDSGPRPGFNGHVASQPPAPLGSTAAGGMNLAAASVAWLASNITQVHVNRNKADQPVHAGTPHEPAQRPQLELREYIQRFLESNGLVAPNDAAAGAAVAAGITAVSGAEEAPVAASTIPAAAQETAPSPTTLAVFLPAFLKLEFGKGIRLGKRIAEGGGGVVYQCDVLDMDFWRNRGLNPSYRYVFKAVTKKPGTSRHNRAYTTDCFYQEVSLMYAMRQHPNCVKLIGWTDEPDLGMLMKQYDMDLTTLIVRRKHEPLPFWRMATDIARALKDLHHFGITHNDVKSSNIFVELIQHNPNAASPMPDAVPFVPVPPSCVVTRNENRFHYRAVLADFGLAYFWGSDGVRGRQKMLTFGLSLPYAGPELLSAQYIDSSVRQNLISKEFSSRLDVYAFAVILWEMLERSRAWAGVPSGEIHRCVAQNKRPAVSSHKRTHPTIPLIIAGWSNDPAKRPSMQEMYHELGRLAHSSASLYDTT